MTAIAETIRHHQQDRAETAAANYAALLASVTAGEEIDPDTAVETLEAAGKTAADLDRDAERDERRAADIQLAALVPALTAQSGEAEREFLAAAKAEDQRRIIETDKLKAMRAKCYGLQGRLQAAMDAEGRVSAGRRPSQREKELLANSTPLGKRVWALEYDLNTVDRFSSAGQLASATRRLTEAQADPKTAKGEIRQLTGEVEGAQRRVNDRQRELTAARAEQAALDAELADLRRANP